MPAEEGIGLHNQEGLFPMTGCSPEQHQEDPIRLGPRWALHLTVEDNELPAEERVFSNEFGPGAGQIVQCSHEEGAACWSRPLQYSLLDPTE